MTSNPHIANHHEDHHDINNGPGERNELPKLAWQFTCDSSRQIFAAGHHQWKYLKGWMIEA